MSNLLATTAATATGAAAGSAIVIWPLLRRAYRRGWLARAAWADELARAATAQQHPDGPQDDPEPLPGEWPDPEPSPAWPGISDAWERLRGQQD